MVKPAPPIDRRTAAEIAEQVKDLLAIYAPQWQEFDPETGEPQGISAALIGVFSHFAEVIISRLNQVPDKNFLAFLNLLGASRLSPQPARVPLTFSLAAGTAVDAIVPAGTQVAAPPAEGQDPVIFETERELVVSAARLVSLFARDPEQDLYGDRSGILTAVEPSGVPIFRGNRAIEHRAYFAHRHLFDLPYIQNLRLNVTLAQPLGDEGQLVWQRWNGSEWQELPTQDAGKHLSTPNLNTISFGVIDPLPLYSLAGRENRWLRCQLLTPVVVSEVQQQGMVRASQLPQVDRIAIAVDVHRPPESGLRPSLALANGVPLDLGQDVFPFGETPQFNATFYLASREALSALRPSSETTAPTESVTKFNLKLEFHLANSHLLPGKQAVQPSADLQLVWEYWDGRNWEALGTSVAPEWLSLLEFDPLPNLTNQDSALRPGSETTVIQGRLEQGASLQVDPAPSDRIVGDEGRFAVRVALTPGWNAIQFTARYGERETRAWVVLFRATQGQSPSVQLTATAPDAPVEAETIELSVSVTGDNADEVRSLRVTNGNLPDASPITRDRNQTLSIPLAVGRNALLVEGLNEGGERIAATTLTIGREANRTPALGAAGFADGTYGFCQSGTVTLNLPADVSPTVVGGQEDYWLRVRLVRGNYGQAAGYKLKDPLNPAEGFVLTLATFRPPLLSAIKLGYEKTFEGLPELVLVEHNRAITDITSKNTAGNSAFPLFHAIAETRPTLYLGFTLPPGRANFPNQTLSLFARVLEVQYGDRPFPIDPERSRVAGNPGASVSHHFEIAHAVLSEFDLAIVGTHSSASLEVGEPERSGMQVVSEPSRRVVSEPGRRTVVVQVTIPPDARPDSRDRGFLKLIATDGTTIYSASFETFVGDTVPSETDSRIELSWQYWNGSQWQTIAVRDGTESFTRPGLVEVLPPADFRPRGNLLEEEERYWLRVQWEKGRYLREPKLQRLLLNTTVATQSVTLRNEILGSSDGSEHQTVRTNRAPVLVGQQLEVREPELPSVVEPGRSLSIVEVAIRGDAVRREVWVPWQEVPDFYGSGPRDRHYVIDHITGEIQFGNGSNGLIPPVGTGNLRMTHYQTGGGTRGNKPPGTIVQLKTTVPYVDSVTNTEAATGGADAETLESLRDRAPRSLRHSGRAVTREDYEDLAHLASPAVARAKCVPLLALQNDPLAEQNPADKTPKAPGQVSVIIVPDSTDAKPVPSLELLDRVQRHLEAHSLPTATVAAVGPLYVSVNVTVEIVLASPEGGSTITQAIERRLNNFLHPLTGGLEGTGWTFGRLPHQSDFYALIGAIPGVDRVRTLHVTDIEDIPGSKATGRFLVYSGTHKITLTLAS